MFARLVICIVNMNYLISVLKHTTLCMYNAYFMKYIVQYCISSTTLLVSTALCCHNSWFAHDRCN